MSSLAETASTHVKPDEMTVVEIYGPIKPVGQEATLQHPKIQLPEARRSSVPAWRSRQTLGLFVSLLAWLLAASGFFVFSVGSGKTARDFNGLKLAAQLSGGIMGLMRDYDRARWAAFAFALAVLFLFPLVMVGAGFASRIFRVTTDTRLKALKRRASASKGLLILLAVVCALATAAAVLAISANVKASDKITEAQLRIQSGSKLLSTLSTTLESLQTTTTSNSTSLVGSALSAILRSLIGTSAHGTSTELISMAESMDLPSIFALIAPLSVGDLVHAIDPSPQGLLSLASLVLKKVNNSPDAGGLQCDLGCLNQVDACICSVTQLPILSDLEGAAQRHSKTALIGACIMAVGLGLLALAAALEAARFSFQQQLVFEGGYDRQIQCKHTMLARNNADIVGISDDTPCPCI